MAPTIKSSSSSKNRSSSNTTTTIEFREVVSSFLIASFTLPLFYVVGIWLGKNITHSTEKIHETSLRSSNWIGIGNSLVKGDERFINSDIGVDFAVIGFAKTGTTFLLRILGNHPDVIMDKHEFGGILKEDGVERTMAWLQNVSNTVDPKLPPKQYGIKNPAMIRTMNGIDNLMKISDHTRLVVGIRHPVLWFQSFYNYRVWGHYHYKRNGIIPKAHELTDGTRRWRDVATACAKFEIYLMQLAKVPLSEKDTNEMLNESLYSSSVSPNPYKVFVYTTEQLNDKNETRQRKFQTDLQHHLRLTSPLTDFTKSNKSKKTYNETINICDSQYDDIRYQLLRQGKKTSDWICNKFIESSDVVVSDKDYFISLLNKWGDDPCKQQ